MELVLDGVLLDGKFEEYRCAASQDVDRAGRVWALVLCVKALVVTNSADIMRITTKPGRGGAASHLDIHRISPQIKLCNHSEMRAYLHCRGVCLAVRCAAGLCSLLLTRTVTASSAARR
jgi:hypothetical protein